MRRKFHRQIGNQWIQIRVRLGLQSGLQPVVQFGHAQATVPSRLLERRDDRVPLAVPDPDIGCRGKILSHAQTLPKWAWSLFSKWPACAGLGELLTATAATQSPDLGGVR